MPAPDSMMAKLAVVRAVRLTPVLAPTASTWLAIWSPVAPTAIEIVLLPRLPASVRFCASTLLAGAVPTTAVAASMSPLLAMVLAPMLVARELAMLIEMVSLALEPTWKASVPKVPSSSLRPPKVVVSAMRLISCCSCDTSACSAARSVPDWLPLARGIVLGAVDAQARGQPLQRGRQRLPALVEVALGVQRRDVRVDDLRHGASRVLVSWCLASGLFVQEQA